MSAPGKKIRVRDQALYDKAVAGLPRNDDASVVETALQAKLVDLLRANFDTEAALYQQASKIIERLTKQAGEDGEDRSVGGLQLSLLNDHYDYNPRRLIKDLEGNIIEEDIAPLRFKMAELQRSSDHVQRATMWNARKTRALTHFQRWTDEQQRAGRPRHDLTWGACIRETDILRGE